VAIYAKLPVSPVTLVEDAGVISLCEIRVYLVSETERIVSDGVFFEILVMFWVRLQ
jgi:hypothetical protein